MCYVSPVPYPSQSIANAFLAKAKENGMVLTNMQVQKLVYFAHGFYLAFKDEPLIKDEIKAWNFGPVIPPLYNALKHHGNGVVSEPIDGYDVPPATDEFTCALITKVFSLYGHISGARLSAATHKEGSPWEKIYKDAKFSGIPNDLIRSYFKGLLRPASATAA